MIRTLLCAVALVGAGTAFAQTPASGNSPPPTLETCATLLGGGSPNVAIGKADGARLGDQTCVRVIDSSNRLLINGRPALRVGDRVQCPDGRVGIIVGGASSVKINDLPAATAASRIQGCD